MYSCLGWCRYTLDDARIPRMMPLNDAHTPRIMLDGLGRWHRVVVDACRPLIMSPNQCAHAKIMHDLDKSYAIGRCHLPHTHMPHLMLAGHDLWHLANVHTQNLMHTLADVAWHWKASFFIHTHTLPDACTPWPLSSSIWQCAHAMNDVI